MKTTYSNSISIMMLVGMIMVCLNASAQLSKFDQNKPFGWATCVSPTETGYKLTGGNAIDKSTQKTTTITANGQDQSREVRRAIENNDIVIIDGSNGDIVFDRLINLKDLKNKTIVGINNARIRTRFQLSKDLIKLLDDAGVHNASTQGGTGDTLSNGKYVSERREYLTRKTLMENGYNDEDMHRAGLFSLRNCENFIIRNLSLEGPGSVDIGGPDCMTMSACNHIWVDHCTFADGADANFDINQGSDFITISWCVFQYSERAYDHMNTNLVGASDKDSAGKDKFHVTYAYCMWGKGCKQRMPMARNCSIHILNCYYNCPGNNMSINPRKGARFLVEGIHAVQGVKLFKTNDAVSCHIRKGYYLNRFSQDDLKCNFGEELQIPYKYKVADAKSVADFVGTHAGNTLSKPLQ